MQSFRIKSICIVSLIVLSAISDSASFLSILRVYDTQSSSKITAKSVRRKNEHDGIREPSHLVRLIRDRSHQYHLSLFRSDIFPSQVRAYQFISRHRNLLNGASQGRWRCKTDCDLSPIRDDDDEDDEITTALISKLEPVDLTSLHASHYFIFHGSNEVDTNSLLKTTIDTATLSSDSKHNESLFSLLDTPLLSFLVKGNSIIADSVNDSNAINTIVIDSSNDSQNQTSTQPFEEVNIAVMQSKAEEVLTIAAGSDTNQTINTNASDTDGNESNHQQEQNHSISAKATELSCVYEADMSDALSPWSPLPALNLALILLVFAMLTFFALFRFLKIVIIYVQDYPEYLFNWLDQECGRLFAEQRFPLAIRVLRWYVPQIRLLFGEHHIHISALKHYLARGLIASGQMESGLNFLFQVLGNYLPYGEDLHVAQVYEDIGYVQYELKQYRAALQSLHATLRIMSEEFACRSFVEQQVKKDPDWMNLSMSNIETSSCDVTPERVDRQQRDSSLVDPTSATKATGAETSPSTMDLNEVFFAQTDLRAAMRDLEHFLGESTDEEEAEEASSVEKIRLFQDLQRIPTVEVARVCKKLADVYSELAAWKYAHVFYCNALAVLQHLAQRGMDHPKAIEELRTSISRVSVKLKQTQKGQGGPAALDYDSLTYQQFYFPSSSDINL